MKTTCQKDNFISEIRHLNNDVHIQIRLYKWHLPSVLLLTMQWEWLILFCASTERLWANHSAEKLIRNDFPYDTWACVILITFLLRPLSIIHPWKITHLQSSPRYVHEEAWKYIGKAKSSHSIRKVFLTFLFI